MSIEDPKKEASIQSQLGVFLSEREDHEFPLVEPKGDPYWDELAFYTNSQYATAFTGIEIHSIVTHFGKKRTVTMEEIQSALLIASRNYFSANITLDRSMLNHRRHFHKGLARAI